MSFTWRSLVHRHPVDQRIDQQLTYRLCLPLPQSAPIPSAPFRFPTPVYLPSSSSFLQQQLCNDRSVQRPERERCSAGRWKIMNADPLAKRYAAQTPKCSNMGTVGAILMTDIHTHIGITLLSLKTESPPLLSKQLSMQRFALSATVLP